MTKRLRLHTKRPRLSQAQVQAHHLGLLSDSKRAPGPSFSPRTGMQLGRGDPDPHALPQGVRAAAMRPSLRRRPSMPVVRFTGED